MRLMCESVCICDMYVYYVCIYNTYIILYICIIHFTQVSLAFVTEVKMKIPPFYCSPDGE